MPSKSSVSTIPMRLDAVDGLRGLLTLTVVFFHTDHVVFLHDLFVMGGLKNLWPTLGFFFVLSGFLLTLLYGRRLTDGRTVADFVVRRAGRLWPMHLVVLGLLFSFELTRAIWSFLSDRPDIVAFVGSRSVGELIRSALLVHGWGFGKDFSWNYPSWTLSTELLAYAVFVAVTFSIKRVDVRLAVAAGIVITGGLAYLYQTEMLKWWWASRVPWCLQGFFFGYLLCWAWERWPIRSRPLGGAVEIGSVMGCLLALTVGVDGLPMYLLWWLCMAGVVYAVAGESGVLSRVLACKPLRWLGDISLSVYLVHFPVIYALNQVFPALSQGRALGSVWLMIALSIAYIAIVVAVGAVGHYCVDGPCRDRLGRFSSRIRRGEVRWPRMTLWTAHGSR